MERINKFCILNVKMEGFKRFKEPYEVRLSEISYVFGRNGQGKSTIADAICYAFCGTPFWGEKSCDRLLNPESKEMKVEVRLVDGDGELHTLTRRKNGNTSTITFDTLQMRQSDLSAKFAEKDIFISLLNPLYFIEKVAEDGREFLQRLVPNVKESDVLSALSENTRKILEGESLLEPEFYIKKRREELKKIEETESEIRGQINLLDEQRREAAKKVDGVLEKGNEIVAKRIALEEKKYSGIDVNALKARQAEISQSLSDGKKTTLAAKISETESRKYESKYQTEALKLKAEIENLKNLCNSILERAKKLKVGDKCNVCHSVVTEESIFLIKEDLKKQYEEAKTKGEGKIVAYKELAELDKKSREKFEEFKAEDLKKLRAEIDGLDVPDISEIAMLEDRIRLGNLSEEEFKELEMLKQEADRYEKEVELLCETENNVYKIEELNKSLEQSGKEKIAIQDKIHAAGEFAAKKAELTLNHLKMKRAAIKLIDVAKTSGEIKDVFRFTYDGKDYKWLSTSEKIRAGLEVRELLTRLTGLCYPLYIDNAECITAKLEAIKGQVVVAYAKDVELTVRLPQRTETQDKEAA